jgi:hypothetical protein
MFSLTVPISYKIKREIYEIIPRAEFKDLKGDASDESGSESLVAAGCNHVQGKKVFGCTFHSGEPRETFTPG